MARLRIVRGKNQGREYELDRAVVVAGSSGTCHIEILDETVSGEHARFEGNGGAWTVRDLGSSNGTMVNRKPVDAVALSPRDMIELGNTTFEFLESAAAPVKADAPIPAREMTDSDHQHLEIIQDMQRRTDSIRNEVAKLVIGQQAVIDQILMCLVAGGHGLLVGLPGMAKTLMVSTVARVLDLGFKRIQFTPDLMPSDITGTEILETDRDTNEKTFRFIRGPVFCNMLLADEINRTPPKTQAALLEAMQEKRVTVGNETFSLDAPFFVLATQNPIEQEGTYPLPEAQMDRFMFNIWVDYPDEEEEEKIVGVTTSQNQSEPQVVLSQQEVLQLQEAVIRIPVSPHVIKYAIRLTRSTRPDNDGSPEVTKSYVTVGAGPRAGQFLILGAKARALLDGRIHVSCADVQAAALPVLRHRLYTNFTADSEGFTSVDIVNKLLEEVTPPEERDYRGLELRRE
jgi:MoxR-like ATPase